MRLLKKGSDWGANGSLANIGGQRTAPRNSISPCASMGCAQPMKLCVVVRPPITLADNGGQPWRTKEGWYQGDPFSAVSRWPSYPARVSYCCVCSLWHTKRGAAGISGSHGRLNPDYSRINACLGDTHLAQINIRNIQIHNALRGETLVMEDRAWVRVNIS